MATKQLSTLNPRNFKEKIELLKKKEAASTANFAAAIRDACEIRQIAVAYDLGRLKPTTSLPHGKAFSVPNMRSSPPASVQLQPSSTDHTPVKTTENLSFVLSSGQHEPACNLELAVPNRLPPPSTALHSRLPVSTNEHVPAFLPTNSPHFGSSDVHLHSGSNAWGYHLPEQYSQGAGTVQTCHQLPYTGAFHSVVSANRSQAVRHCSGPVPLLSTDYASCTSEHPWPATAPISSVSSNPSLLTSWTHANVSQPPLNQHMDGKPLGSLSTRSCNTFSLHLMPTHASSSQPYFAPIPQTNSTNFDSYHFSPQGYAKHPTNPHSLLPCVGARDSEISDFATAPKPTSNLMHRVPPMGIDWRRVSSDSSICNSLVTYQSASRDPHYTYQYDARLTSPSHKDSTPVGYNYSSYGSKKPESLRRHFPSDPIVDSPAYATNNLNFPNRLPDRFAFRCYEHGPSEEQHLLPPKRPFTSFYKAPSYLTNTADSKYGMHNLTLEDAKRSTDSYPNPCLGTEYLTKQCLLSTVHSGVNHSTSPHPSPLRPPCVVSSSSAPNINISQPSAPWSNGSVIDRPHPPGTNSPLPELYACDPADLDRYLQIPNTLLDPDDGGGKWTGRRDSCTMTAEVLSALSTVRSASPAFPSEKAVGVDSPTSAISATNKTTDLPAYSNPLPSLTESQEEYNSAEPLIDEHLTLPPPQTNLRQSNFQAVAHQLGISITSKDYQLLTDPQLANYVTDETTEAQLLR